MPTPVSAGLLVRRRVGPEPEVLLVHPGGPFWRNKDAGAWTVPKGAIEPGETPLEAALREFAEETGLAVDGPYAPLTPIRQSGGKRVLCWLADGDPDLAAFRSLDFELEWPPRSGLTTRFPEVDRIAWFAPDAALAAILKSQQLLIREALERP